jgi:hypothetical protein
MAVRKIGQQNVRDQETRNDEKNIDSHKPTRQQIRESVEYDDRQNSDRTQTIDIGTIGLPLCDHSGANNYKLPTQSRGGHRSGQQALGPVWQTI